MSIKFIGKRSVLYTLSKIISAVLSLLSISLFTRIFDADTYGQYLLFVSYVTLICSLFFWWHRLSTYRYYHKYKQYYDSFLKTSYLSFFLIISSAPDNLPLSLSIDNSLLCTQPNFFL